MSSTPASANTPNFDRLSFVRYVKDIGRPYRKRAVELISISRTFVRAQEQSLSIYDDLRSVLEVVDVALSSATKAQKRTLQDVDDNFKGATDALSAYEERHHPNAKISIAERMKIAEENDKSSLRFLNRLKENWRPLVEEPTKIVKFFLLKSLCDKDPTIVNQVLCRSSGVKEILWNFSRYSDEKKRLRLRQNPHFYTNLPDKYGGGFQTCPTESFYHDRIRVLTDKSGQAGRVYLGIPKSKRVFSNVWDARDVIVFKDIFGTLEGEGIIGSIIQDTPNLWCLLTAPNSSTSTMPPIPMTSPTGELLRDWKQPIRRMMLYSLDVNIRISTRPATDFRHSYSQDSALPSPNPLFGSNCSVDNLIKIHTPESPTRSSTPLSYKTALSKPLPQLPPVVQLSPRSPKSSSPETLVSPFRPTSTQASSTIVPLSMPRGPRPLPRPPIPLPMPPSPLPSFPLPMPPTSPPLHMPMPSPSTPPSFPVPMLFPPTGPALPTPTRNPFPGTSLEVESQKDTFSRGHIPSQPELIADAPPVTTNPIISPWHDISTRRPHTKNFRDENPVGDSPDPDPDTEDEDLSDEASTVTPTHHIREKRRKWYQRIFNRVFRRELRQPNASMPNLSGNGTSFWSP